MYIYIYWSTHVLDACISARFSQSSCFTESWPISSRASCQNWAATFASLSTGVAEVGGTNSLEIKKNFTPANSFQPQQLASSKFAGIKHPKHSRRYLLASSWQTYVCPVNNHVRDMRMSQQECLILIGNQQLALVPRKKETKHTAKIVYHWIHYNLDVS